MDIDVDYGDQELYDSHNDAYSDESDSCDSSSNNKYNDEDDDDDKINRTSSDGMDLDLDLAQGENSLLAPPDQESPSHILKALNDHCLCETFKRLHFLDLLNVVKVCKRFEIQAKAAFTSQYKKLELDIRQCDRNTMENILIIFGSSIRSLLVDSNQNTADTDLFRTIIQHCSIELKELILDRLNIQVDAPSFRLPFTKLEELGLFSCAGSLNLTHLIDGCPNLKRIRMTQCNLQGINAMIDRRFVQLKELQIIECDFDVDTDALEHFTVLNPALIKLVIRLPRLRTSSAIRLIGQNMGELLELDFMVPTIDDKEHFQSDVQMIGGLRSMKRLELNLNSMEVMPLANALATNNVPIGSLYIVDGIVDDTAIDRISRLKQLTTLELHDLDGFNEDHLIALARNLNELQEFSLSGVNIGLTLMGFSRMLNYGKKLRACELSLKGDPDGFTINADDYKAMVDSIQNRPEKSCLSVYIYDNNKIIIKVPISILMEHQSILQIEIL